MVRDGRLGDKRPIDCREQVPVGLEFERAHGRRVEKVRVEPGKFRHDTDLRALAERVPGVQKEILLLELDRLPHDAAVVVAAADVSFGHGRSGRVGQLVGIAVRRIAIAERDRPKTGTVAFHDEHRVAAPADVRRVGKRTARRPSPAAVVPVGGSDRQALDGVRRHAQVPDQSVRHWIMAHRRAFEYFGGVPGRWVIDNLKAGVDKPDREEPRLNPSFREFARHYGVAVLPARSGRATDKGLVESCVGAVQSRILPVLRHRTFFSLDAMNAAIRREFDRLNQAPMACGETRRALFEASERALLKPLPRNPWEWGEWIERKVGPSCHERIARNHYSAPERHIGRKIHARVGERMVELFLDKGGERIAIHRLKSGRNQYATDPGHMPDRLNAVRDIREPDYGDILLERARKIGPNAMAWAERCFASRDFPEQAFATVQGMIRLAEDHDGARLDALCAEALDLNRLASGFLRERLRNGAGPDRRRAQARETIPDHANIRGGDYYGNDEGATP